MSGRSRVLVLAVFLVIAASLCSAAIPAVAVQPKEYGEAVATLYPSEVLDYEVVVSNTSEEKIENLALVVYVDDGLKIVRDNKELEQWEMKIDLLRPYDTMKEDIKIKALRYSEKNFYINVDYGTEVFTNRATTYVKLAHNPLKIDARLTKTALNPNEETSIILDLVNESEEITVSNIKAEIVVPYDVEALSGEQTLDMLEPGQQFMEMEFKFIPKEGVTGDKTITLLLSYDDSMGTHTIEKNLVVDIQDRMQYFLVIIVLIVVLGAAALFLRKKGDRGQPAQKAEANKNQA